MRYQSPVLKNDFKKFAWQRLISCCRPESTWSLRDVLYGCPPRPLDSPAKSQIAPWTHMSLWSTWVSPWLISSFTSNSTTIHPDTMRSVCRLHNSVAAPLPQLGSVQCAPHSVGVSPHRGLGIEARLHREPAMMPPTASQRRPAIGFARRVSLRGHRCREKGFRKQKKNSESTCNLQLSNEFTFKYTVSPSFYHVQQRGTQ